jgi:hypothetical protein
MPIKIAEFDRLWLKDRDGTRRECRPLPLPQREYFKDLHRLCLESTNGLADKATIGDCYDSNDDFRFAVDCQLELFGLKAEWFNIAQVSLLLFGDISPDGQIRPGLLIRLEFPPREGGEPLPADVDPFAHMVAALSSHYPQASLTEIFDMIERIPWNTLEAIMSERNRLAEPKETNSNLPEITDEEKQLAEAQILDIMSSGVQWQSGMGG